MPLDSWTTVDKAFDVLFHLSAVGTPQGVSAIGEALGMPKSSAHRLLATLGRRGLVEREGRGLYRPGMGLVALGLGVLDRDPLVVAARPVLESWARELGETFFLVSTRGSELVVLDKCEGSGFLRASPRIGSSLPPRATAVGKLYYAFAPELLGDELEGPAVFTSGTLDADALAADIARVREVGWAANRDEWIAGMSVIAAPIPGVDRLRGAVALAAASPRLEELGGDERAADVCEAAARIAERLRGEIQ